MPGELPSSTKPPQSAAIPAWITTALIARTRQVCEFRYGHPLTDEAIIEIIMAVGALGDVLRATDPLDNLGDSRPPERQQETA